MAGLQCVVAASSSVDDILAILERDGGVIIEDFFDPETFAALKADLLPKVEAVGTGDDDFTGFKTRRLSNLFRHTPHMAAYFDHPMYIPLAERIINRPVTYFAGEAAMGISPGLRVGQSQVIQIAPGEKMQPLHRDDWAFLWRHPAYGREARLQSMLAISDFTEENGATMVIPGSHTWDDLRIPTVEECVPAVMKAGSLLMWLGSTYHSGGANRTADIWRTGLTMAIDAANVRQEENVYLALTREEVAAMPEKVQRMLGWASMREITMGWIERDGKLIDPIELLHEPAG